MANLRVIGIGQRLRGDDGAGLAAVQLWDETLREQVGLPNLSVTLAESPGAGLLDLLEGAEGAVLVDAVQGGAEPGSLYLLSEGELAAFTAGAGSAHGWGVAEALALGRVVGFEGLPKKIVIIGIEAGSVEVGGGLSPEVAAVLPQAARLISKALEELQVSQGDEDAAR
jgi:hydrogenase maturation protease